MVLERSLALKQGVHQKDEGGRASQIKRDHSTDMEAEKAPLFGLASLLFLRKTLKYGLHRLFWTISSQGIPMLSIWVLFPL
jgi:hypothetical protein